jgi:hypothetical protein
MGDHNHETLLCSSTYTVVRLLGGGITRVASLAIVGAALIQELLVKVPVHHSEQGSIQDSQQAALELLCFHLA